MNPAYIDEKKTRPILISLWDHKNPIAEEYFRRHLYRYLETLKRIPFQPGMKVLDVGILPCHMSIVLKRLGIDVSGIDFDPERYGFGEVWRGEKIEVRRCDIEKEAFPFVDSSFDAVLFSEVIEHLHENPQIVLREIHRVLRPGGMIVVTTPNVATLNNRIKMLLGLNVHPPNFYDVLVSGHQRHYYEYTMSELAKSLAKADFIVDQKAFLPAYERALFDGVHDFGLQGMRKQLVRFVYPPITAIFPFLRSVLFVVGTKK